MTVSEVANARLRSGRGSVYVINDNGGRCRDVGQTSDGLPAFLYVQPCAQSVSADVAFDSTKASNGVHRLTVSVIDAVRPDASAIRLP